MKKLIALLFSIFFLYSPSVFAEDISGAFGLILGDIYEGELNQVAKISTGEILYGFDPVNPNHIFSNYGVILTHKSKKIAGIWAWNKFNNSEKCETNHKIIEVLLDKKYGSLKKDIIYFDSVVSSKYVSGNRIIRLRCPTKILYLKYYDQDLRQLSILEQSETINSDGL